MFEEICAEFDNSVAVSSTNENGQQSSSDISIILEDENVQVESEPAFDGVKALTQIVDLAMNIHFKSWKVMFFLILQCVCTLEPVQSYKLHTACQRRNDSTVRVQLLTHVL